MGVTSESILKNDVIFRKMMVSAYQCTEDYVNKFSSKIYSLLQQENIKRCVKKSIFLRNHSLEAYFDRDEDNIKLRVLLKEEVEKIKTDINFHLRIK